MASPLIKFLTDRKKQLEQRKIMIPKYLEHPHAFLGKNNFTVEDIARIELEIKECDAALKAIKRIKKMAKK